MSLGLSNTFLFKNGVFLPTADTPVGAFLEAHPGAYTTTRTTQNGKLLMFWERHMLRLSNSFQLLLKENPKLLFEESESIASSFWGLLRRSAMWDSLIPCMVNDCMRKSMDNASVKERKFEDPLAITVLVGGHSRKFGDFCGGLNEERIVEALDVYTHIGRYVPPVFGVRGSGARLAMVHGCRDFANAKYSNWARARKHLERMRSPSITELLLTNDGDQILEGCLTNFFVVCFKEKGDNCINEHDSFSSLEVQTAPVSDGVLPGVIRQVIKDVCLKIGISFREVAPSWSNRELWVEAFVTSSLRIVQHVETIQAPDSWKSIDSKTWEEISWVEKRFEVVPGRITTILQEEIWRSAGSEAFSVASCRD